MLSDHLEFLRQFRTRFHTTGAVAPSSRFLAKAMTRPIRLRDAPARILEVGPGTGAVTRQIVRLLRPHDRLDLVELNTAFAELLRRRFEEDPIYRRVAAQSEVHVCSIDSFQPAAEYDFIVSGLPFNNFDPEFVDTVMESFFDMLAAGGILSFFEYMYVRPLRAVVGPRSECSRMKKLDAVVQSFLHPHRFRRDWVFFNLPPAWVQHLRKEMA
jgi:phospholipid N-methyltransferase